MYSLVHCRLSYFQVCFLDDATSVDTLGPIGHIVFPYRHGGSSWSLRSTSGHFILRTLPALIASSALRLRHLRVPDWLRRRTLPLMHASRVLLRWRFLCRRPLQLAIQVVFIGLRLGGVFEGNLRKQNHQDGPAGPLLLVVVAGEPTWQRPRLSLLTGRRRHRALGHSSSSARRRGGRTAASVPLKS